MNAIASAARQSAVEVKKHSLRQSKDGLVVSFVVHPNDIPDTLLTAPIGQRYVLALVAMSDDETPITDVPVPNASERAKAVYQASSPGEQARARSILLCRDPEFQAWAQCTDEAEAATFIRRKCLVNTRAAFATNAKALDQFLSLEREFKDSVRFGVVR